MSESTRTTSDGGDPEGLDLEDLFATDDTDISIEDGESDDHTASPGAETTTSEPDGSAVEPDDSTDEPDGSTAAAEDTTAAALFQQLRDEHGDEDEQVRSAPDLDESPEEIVARADEDEAHVDQIDESIRADENALDDLLLTERRKADGFLWVETDGESNTASDDAGGDTADDVESPFAPAGGESDSADANADANASGSSPDTTQLVDDSAAGDVSPDEGFSLESDDEFSLESDEPDPFDARAATFDGELAFDEEEEEDAAADGDEVDSANDDEDGSSVDEADGDEADEDEADGDVADGDEDEDDGEDGLAARIRSILTG